MNKASITFLITCTIVFLNLAFGQAPIDKKKATALKVKQVVALEGSQKEYSFKKNGDIEKVRMLHSGLPDDGLDEYVYENDSVLKMIKNFKRVAQNESMSYSGNQLFFYNPVGKIDSIEVYFWGYSKEKNLASKFKYIYDDQNRVMQKIGFRKWSHGELVPTDKDSMVYDKNVVKEEYKIENGKIRNKTVYNYDKAGNVAEERIFLPSLSTPIRVKLYNYNDKGLLTDVAIKMNEHDDQPLHYLYTYTYYDDK